MALEAVEFSDSDLEGDVGSYFADIVSQMAQDVSSFNTFIEHLLDFVIMYLVIGLSFSFSLLMNMTIYVRRERSMPMITVRSSTHSDRKEFVFRFFTLLENTP